MKKLLSALLVILMCASVCACGAVDNAVEKVTEVKINSIVFATNSCEITEGETFTVSYNIYPTDATEEKTWSSANTAIATVDQNGVITAVSEGSTNIILSSKNGITAVCSVTVKKLIPRPDFQAIYDGLSSTYGIEVADDGSYLSLDTNLYNLDDYYNSSTLAVVKEIHKALNIPDSLYQAMMKTSYSMGRQTETYPSLGVTVSWTYHPDKGMEVTYKHIND